MFHKIPPHLPCLPAGRRSGSETKGRRNIPPFDKWFDMLIILSLSKEGDEGGLDNVFQRAKCYNNFNENFFNLQYVND